jgi:hypothetical protein
LIAAKANSGGFVVDSSKITHVPPTLVPVHFLPAIGLVIVHHAFMDSQLQAAIRLLAGNDYKTGVSILAPVTSTAIRAGMLQNLARTTARDLSFLCKLLVLGDVIILVSNQRNILAHTLPYAYSPPKDNLGPLSDEILYFREVNKTIPQIKIQPPYKASLESLAKLSYQISLIGVWLGMLQRTSMPDGMIIPGMSTDEIREVVGKQATHHPHWDNDALFPWPDKLARKLRTESRNQVNRERVPKRQRSPSKE